MFGTIVDFGNAPYQFKDNQSESFFLTLANGKGKATIWSIGLADALSGFTKGDVVKVRHDGKKPVRVPVFANGKSGKIIRYKDVHRNFYTITHASDVHAVQRSSAGHTDMDGERSIEQRICDAISVKAVAIVGVLLFFAYMHFIAYFFR